MPFPRLDVDSAAPASLKNRARTAVDPVDGLNLYFRGNDVTSRCRSGGAWNFKADETQRCWDKYVNDRNGVLGQGMREIWLQAVVERVPAKQVELNQRAFDQGRSAV